MHAPSRSPYDPGEKLTVTGLSSGSFICRAGGGGLRWESVRAPGKKKSITEWTGC